MEKIYLRILNDGKFGFMSDQIHEILNTDILISKEDHQEFLRIQSEELAMFYVKDFEINKVKSLFDIIGYTKYLPEENIANCSLKENMEIEIINLKERIAALEEAIKHI